MGWFRNSHGARIADLERTVAALTARVVKAEATASECAERAYRYMKKAEARARREVDEPNQETATGAAPERETPAASTSSRVPWGARGRRVLARLRRPDPLTEANGHTEG